MWSQVYRLSTVIHLASDSCMFSFHVSMHLPSTQSKTGQDNAFRPQTRQTCSIHFMQTAVCLGLTECNVEGWATIFLQPLTITPAWAPQQQFQDTQPWAPHHKSQALGFPPSPGQLTIHPRIRASHPALGTAPSVPAFRLATQPGSPRQLTHVRQSLAMPGELGAT